jgi:hypothetical protein
MKTNKDSILLVCEASPIVGNLAYAIYIGGFDGPVLGTFTSKDEADGFVSALQRIIRLYGGEELIVDSE